MYGELQTGTLPVLSAIQKMQAEFSSWLHQNRVHHNLGRIAWGVERQMPQGDVNGWLMMVAMLAIFQVIEEVSRDEVTMVAPYPNQLKSYIRQVHSVPIGSKQQIRRGHSKLTKGKLVSSHKAEAWFLARMAQDVLDGRWSFDQSATRPKLAPWKLRTKRGFST